MDGLPGRLTGDDQGAARVARPEQVDVQVGLDAGGKEDHFAEVPGDAGERIFARGVAGDEAALEALLDRAGRLRDALTSVSPALERALGSRLAQAGVRDLLARYPALTALRNTHRREIADAA